jgi:hypothetical protein
MAKIIVGTYMVRYPLGAILSWTLQYLVGLRDLGHDVYSVETALYPNACFDVAQGAMSDDCGYGLGVVSEFLKRFGFDDKWSFVDVHNTYYGLDKGRLQEAFNGSDLFIDSGTWMEESESSALTVLIDTDPGFTQMKWATNLDNGRPVPRYDRYFTNGLNVGTPECPVPTAGVTWEYMFNPVNTRLFTPAPSVAGSRYSTVMNWQSHGKFMYRGKEYGHKDIEFPKILSLPLAVDQPLEVAVAGNAPVESLKQHKWHIEGAHAVTRSFYSFQQYLLDCRGELSVCKNMYVENTTGWFSEKSAAFLASGRPVILQETGFSKHLPVGKGLFAFSDADEARDAINTVEADYASHSEAAREIACEYLDTAKVLKGLLVSLGI